VHEERRTQLELSDDVVTSLQKKREEMEASGGELREVLEDEIEILKAQLLILPKRDRLGLELSGDAKYDSNISRRIPRQEKGDSVLDARSSTLIDLSGKKTDFRFEFGWRKQWNIVFSEKDSWQVEERLRYRRKYFKKISHSSNSRISRHNSKTNEIDENKIRWDFINQMAMNYPFSRKLSLNLDTQSTKRLFRQEAFDQDSGWQATFAPSAFWTITPKSRVQAGYTFGASRTRVKSGDSNSHDIRLGYFGKVSGKSSISLDFAYQHQTPRSRDTAEVNSVTTGLGYIWQMTPKTQMTSQYTREFRNSTSDLVSGSVDGPNVTTKVDTHFVSDNISFSINSRLLKKLTAILTVSGLHTRTKTFNERNVEGDTETRQFSFPIDISLNYAIRRTIIWSMKYAFAFRTGNEKSDTSRAHTWRTSLRLIF